MQDFPSVDEARALLDWALERNPGPWGAHSRGVARAAREIARAAGLDAERAYVCGLMHDVGRYEGVRGLHHAIAGYDLLKERGWPGAARVCVTHSFPDGVLEHFGGGAMDVDEAELKRIRAELARPFDEYDRLCQLCDAISWGEDVCLMEKRLVDVALRHGEFPGMVEKWRAFKAIQVELEARIGGSIYALFPECAGVTLGIG